MPKAYSYLRFSTPEQQKGDSKRRQLEGAKQYAATHQLDLDDALTFHDLGVSAFHGRNAEVGRLAAFLKAVDDGLVEPNSYLLVENLDRISRLTARKALTVLGEIVDRGITLVTMSDGRSYTKENLDNDPMALLMSILTFIRANDESATKSRRVKAAWDAKRANASDRPMTARGPAWLSYDKAAQRFTVDKERGKIVKRVFRDALRGDGQHRIADALNRERQPVFGRGKHWHRTYIAKLLRSPAVMGTLVPHTAEYVDGKKTRKPMRPIENYYPPIIDPDMYERVQLVVRRSKNPRRGRHATGEVHNIFGGLARCPRCGSTATLVNKGATPKGGRYLVCTKAKTGAGCRYDPMRYELVEAAFLAGAPRIISEAPAGDGAGAVDADLENVETAIGDLDGQLMNLLNALEHGAPATLTERIRQLENQRDSLRREQEALADRQLKLTAPAVLARLREFSGLLKGESLDRTGLNTLLRQLFTQVTVDRTKGIIDVLWRQGGDGHIAFALPEALEPRKGRSRAKRSPRAN